MTTAELQWLIGTSITVLFAIAGMIVTAFYKVSSLVAEEVKKRSEQTATLHGRVEQLKDDLNGRIDQVKEDYVRNDYMETHLSSIRESIRMVADRLERIDGKIDRIAGK